MRQRRLVRPMETLLGGARGKTGSLLVIAGAMLAAFTLRSSLVSAPAITPAESPTNQVRRPAYPTASDLSAVRAALRSGEVDEPFNLGILNRLVYRATLHTDDRVISFEENWLQSSLACVYPPLARIQNAERLALGVGANCSERAQILKTLVEHSGRRCRFVGLNGHVVLEVETEDGWRVADPDYGVVYPVNMKELTQADSALLIWFRLGSRGYPPGAIQSYVEMVHSTNDNVTLPIGSALSPRLYLVEVLCQWLVWCIPSTMCLVGWWLLRQPQQRSAWHPAAFRSASD